MFSGYISNAMHSEAGSSLLHATGRVIVSGLEHGLDGTIAGIAVGVLVFGAATAASRFNKGNIGYYAVAAIAVSMYVVAGGAAIGTAYGIGKAILT